MAGERLRAALQTYRKRYHKASRDERTPLLDEFCAMSGYHRKYAITLLNRRDDEPDRPRRRRGPTYSAAALKVIERIWLAAGCPWSVRLKALLPLWLPWARPRLKGLTGQVEREVLQISARQIDRRLADKKRRRQRRGYGRTKPATLLRRQIPVQAGFRGVCDPGCVEVDLVSHSGPSARGEFAYTLNLTDIVTSWCESRAVLGRGEHGVVAALNAIREGLPFAIQAMNSDNGSEFINHHLLAYTQEHGIAFTRSRPYKKDDNAHVEQKNWTHVRRLLGWDRYDTPEQVAAMNALYAGELRLMMNLYQPGVRLIERQRVGTRLTRRYDPAQTPLDRLVDWHGSRRLSAPVRALIALREELDPFALSDRIDQGLRALTPTPTPASNRRTPRGR